MSLKAMTSRWMKPLKKLTALQTMAGTKYQAKLQTATLLNLCLVNQCWLNHGIRAAIAGILLAAVASCASSGDSSVGGRGGFGASPIQVCKSGDQPIRTSASCLVDDAACYQLSDGSWCTGARDDACPTGSSKLPQGQACPAGGRCFSISDEFTCAITG